MSLASIIQMYDGTFGFPSKVLSILGSIMRDIPNKSGVNWDISRGALHTTVGCCDSVTEATTA